jgi:hypothetical protein
MTFLRTRAPDALYPRLTAPTNRLLPTSLFGDLVAALREHGSETLDEHAVTGANPANGSLRFRHYVGDSSANVG